jgi:rhomboid protease GluP
VSVPYESTPPPADVLASQQAGFRLPLAQPRATYVLLAINVAVAVLLVLVSLQRGYGITGNIPTPVLLDFGAHQSTLIAAGEFWRLGTSMFLHGGLIHLLFNSYALYILGRDVESLYGTARFLAIYLLSGLGGSIAFYLIGYLSGNDNPSVGASGAIFGLFGAEASYFWIHRKLLGRRAQANLRSLATVLLVNLFIGFTLPYINNTAHFGGLVTGAVLGWLLVPRYTMPAGLIPGEVLTLQDQTTLQSKFMHLVVVMLVLALLTAGATVLWNGSPQARLNQAIELIDGEDYAAATQILHPLAADHPDDGVVLFYLGAAEANQGHLEAARQAWEDSASLEPDLASTHWNLAQVYA